MKNFLVLGFALIPALVGATETVQISQIKDMYPGLSPDGSRVVFQSNRSGSNQVWIMNADGSEPEQLTNVGGDGAETPVWSPDGKSIVYAAYLDEDNNDVFLMKPDGTEVTQVTFGPGYDGHPHWTADGGRIVFNSDRDTPEADAPWNERWHDIWSVKADGSDARKHTDCRSVCTYGSLSPDGQQVLYRMVNSTSGLDWDLSVIPKNSEIYLADSDGRNARVIAPHPAFDGWPLWSPNGQWIVFGSNRDLPALTGQLWLVRPDGSDLQQFTVGDWGHAQPAFSSDGKSILAYRFQERPDAEFGGIARFDFKPTTP